MLQDSLLVVEIVAGILLRFALLVDPVALKCQHLIVFMIKSPQALMVAGKEPFPTIYVDSQKEGEVGLKQTTNENLYFYSHILHISFLYK